MYIQNIKSPTFCTVESRQVVELDVAIHILSNRSVIQHVLASMYFKYVLHECDHVPIIRFYSMKQNSVYLPITYMKKLLDSDWLRSVQLKSNTSAKSIIPVQITNQNS